MNDRGLPPVRGTAPPLCRDVYYSCCQVPTRVESCSVHVYVERRAVAADNAHKASFGEIFTRDFLLLATINLAAFFGFQMVNVGLPLYMDQLGATGQVVGLATTLMTITATAVRIFAGAMLDRFGRVGMLIAGTLIMACTIIAYAIFPLVGVILGLRLLHGIGWGMGSTASSTLAADIIPKKRFAEGMGYFAMTNALSSALAPVASLALVNGPGAVYMIYAAAGITALAVVFTLVERHFYLRNSTAKAGTQEQTAAEANGAADGNGPAAPQPQKYSKLETLFDRRAVLPGLLMLLVNIGFGCITTFIALHADNQGVAGVSSYFVVYAIVTFASRPVIGRMIDQHGFRIPSILATLCTAGTLALIGAATSLPMFVAAGVLGGLGIGTAMGTYQTMAVANVEPWRRGVATSTYMTLFDIGIAIGALVGGIVVDVAGYSVMYYVVAAFSLAACLISCATIKSST